jgi:chromosomal replication initiator protein
MERDQDIWQNILDKLEEHVNEQSFRTWFSDTTLIDLDDSHLLVKVPTKFAADYLNQNYQVLLSEISYGLYKKKYHIKFTNQDASRPVRTPAQDTAIATSRTYRLKMNARYTFEQFVVGKSNQFAHSASMAVAESPGTTYNPLFIYGESGMGKTHLMQAIGDYVLRESDSKIVYYTTTEEFTTEMIESIQKKDMMNFRNKYRNIDVLLLDDIHFLARKEGTQEEFFHTFNALYENKKQIVLTSDRPLKEIHDLEKRLVTRFEWGLTADLKSPDFETRAAILRKKAENEGIRLIPETIAYIAEHISSNVRALEGSLIRLLAFASYNNIDTDAITPEMVEEILTDMISEKVKEINMERIMQKVCDAYAITPTQMLDKTRKKNIAFSRQVAMYLSNLLIPQLSLKEVALFYKRKDHTTVLHAKKMIENLFISDNRLRIQIEQIIKEIKNA